MFQPNECAPAGATCIRAVHRASVTNSAFSSIASSKGIVVVSHCLLQRFQVHWPYVACAIGCTLLRAGLVLFGRSQQIWLDLWRTHVGVRVVYMVGSQPLKPGPSAQVSILRMQMPRCATLPEPLPDTARPCQPTHTASALGRHDCSHLISTHILTRDALSLSHKAHTICIACAPLD